MILIHPVHLRPLNLDGAALDSLASLIGKLSFYWIQLLSTFTFGWASLFRVFGDISLINTPLEAFQIPLVSRTIHRYHHHLTHQNNW